MNAEKSIYEILPVLAQAALRSAAERMSRRDAIRTLKQLAKGELLETHEDVPIARTKLGSEAYELEKIFKRQHRDEAGSHDLFVRGKHRRADGSFETSKRR